MVHKVGKPSEDVKSYRPLSVQNKVFYHRLHHLLPSDSPLEHPFGFQVQHSTVDQVQRVTLKIPTSFEEKQYYLMVFLDMTRLTEFGTLDSYTNSVTYSHKIFVTS